MKELREIVQIISKKQVKKQEVLGFLWAGKKSQKLYEFVKNNESPTDAKAIRFLYKEYNEKNVIAFSKLKSSLKKRLINSIVFTNANSFSSEKEKVYYEVQRSYLEVKLLLISGSTKLGLKKAQALLKKTEKYDLRDIELFLLRILINQYVLQGNMKLYKKVDSRLQNVKQTNDIIIEAERMYLRLLSQVVSSKAPSKALLKEASEYEKYLDTLQCPSPSSRFVFLKKAIAAFHLMASFKYVETVSSLEDGLKELESYNYVDRGMVLSLTINLALCNIYIKNFISGEERVAQVLALSKKSTFNWTQAMSTSIVLAFHSENYERLLSIYLQVTTDKIYRKLPPIFQELWKLNFAWIRLLAKMNKLEIPDKYTKGKFNIKGFMGTVRKVAKDKEGLNVNVLIWKVLWLLVHEDYDELFKIEESIKRYKERYALKKRNVHRRAYLMLRYILAISKRDFVEYRCVEITKTVRSNFAKRTIEFEWGNFDIEILPFEKVVDLFEETLKKNSRRI